MRTGSPECDPARGARFAPRGPLREVRGGARGYDGPVSDPPPPLRARFGRAQRIVRTADFGRCFKEGSRARGGLMLVVVRRNGLGHSRLGLSVGRVIWKQAVRRNRIKRIFREAFRLEQHALPRGFDLVLVPGAPRLEPELEASRAELLKLAHKAARRFDEKNPSQAEPGGDGAGG